MNIKFSLFDRVKILMSWSDYKTFRWFNAKNPHFGNMKPIDLICMGRIKKVIAFVKAMEDENK